MSSSRIQRLPRLAEDWIREGAVRTGVLLGARRGRIVLHEAFGPLSSAPESPPTPLNARFHLESAGKAMTAAAVMILVEEGRVGLNRPAVEYLPEFRGEGKDAVLVRHLLTHTSGLRDEDVDRYARAQAGKVAIPPVPEGLHPIVQEYLALRYEAPLWKPPGQEMSYSPYSFELLGELV
jgi:serine-type D-Ala-D-Ala carboxypeptidase